MIKLLFVLTLISFNSVFGQFNKINHSESGLTWVVPLKNKTVLYAQDLLFKTDSMLYFSVEGDVNFYKINLSKLNTVNLPCQQYNSEKIGIFLMKFVKQANLGYTMMISGTLASAILPFVITNIPLLVLPPMVSLTGLIVLISSYKHLKRYSIVESAIEFKTLD